MTRMLALAILVGCHTPYVHDERPRRIDCEAQIKAPVVEAGKPVHVKVTLTNRGPSQTFIPRRIERANATWIIDGKDLATRTDEALRAIQPDPYDAAGTSFSGSIGDPIYHREDYVERGPQSGWSITTDVAKSVEGFALQVKGIDVSDAIVARRVLAEPGVHTLQLIVKSYPADQMVGPGWDYEIPFWEARCNSVQVTTEARGAARGPS
jgi:hypothetical protein